MQQIHTARTCGGDDAPRNMAHARHHMRNAVARRFRALRRRFHRSSSSYSIRSDFPAPPAGRERRLLSRASADIYPSSGEETPIFNTPQSGMTPIPPVGGHINLLAIAGTSIAIENLDHLSAKSEKTEADSEMTVFSSDELPTGQVPPSAPDFIVTPPSGPSAPASPLKRPQRRRAATRSRLSEVTTPDGMNSPERSPLNIGSSNTSKIEEVDYYNQNHHDLYPRPLAVRHKSDSLTVPETPQPHQLPSKDCRYSSPPPIEEGRLLKYWGTTKIDMSGEIRVPARSTSVGKIPPPDGPQSSHSLTEPNLGGSAGFPVLIPNPTHVECSPDRSGDCNTDASGTNSTRPTNAPNKSQELNTNNGTLVSYHPDTWDASQGEPGDSDPFCPPQCGTRYSEVNAHETTPYLRVPGKSASGTILTMRSVDSQGIQGDQDTSITGH